MSFLKQVNFSSKKDKLELFEFMKSLESNYYVTFEKKEDKRSASLNNYYHKVVVRVTAEFTGHTELEIHDYLKKEFDVPSTAKLNNKDFSLYIDKCIAFLNVTFDLNIEPPEKLN